MGESQGIGVGAAGFAGAAAGLAGGVAAGGVAGAVAAGAEGVAAGGEAGFSGGVLGSDCTEPEAVAFTPPGTAG